MILVVTPPKASYCKSGAYPAVSGVCTTTQPFVSVNVGERQVTLFAKIQLVKLLYLWVPKASKLLSGAYPAEWVTPGCCRNQVKRSQVVIC